MDITNKNYGFTLIELSIVLVIISLIVGGVVGGKSLIKSAQRQQIVANIYKYASAINAYQLQYAFFPGDHRDAQDYFGATACPDYAGTNTCNGTGDGFTKRYTGTGEADTYESARVWQHLSLAELIEGQYPGDGGGNFGVDDNGAPSIGGLQPQAGYEFKYFENNRIYRRQGHYLVVSGNANYSYGGAALPVLDAIAIDKKADDGKPTYGKWVAVDYDNDADCITGGSDYSDPDGIVWVYTGEGLVCNIGYHYSR
ncbi:MAG: type II secretion system GspH family protein [Agarilytica sp.]